MNAIRVIDFEDFKKCFRFPKFSTLQTKLLQDLNSNNACLNVFISHNWLRRQEFDTGWDGRPHPDNERNEKFELCVQGIEQLKTWAPLVENVYIWFDYSCRELHGEEHHGESLDRIIEWSDVIFTPIVDEDYHNWERPLGQFNVFDDYNADSWKGKKGSYLERAWCRLEMLYAARLPLDSEALAPDRVEKFRLGLKFALSKSRRLHVIYGTKELKSDWPLVCLPPLTPMQQFAFNPTQGAVHNADDLSIVSRLFEEFNADHPAPELTSKAVT